MEQAPAPAISAHAAVSLDFIRSSGGFAVRVLRGQKRPIKGWNPSGNDANKSEIVLRELAVSQVDNFGIHLHGLLVDVDIDSDSPALLAAMDRMLPPCNHIWGHASRLRTHRVYILKEDFNPGDHSLLDRIKRIDDVRIECRGGPLHRGEYSLVPGSVHPSGEDYLWADLKKARSTPAIVTIVQILTAIRLAGAIAVLAPYWTQGLRNDLVMALSGFLHRTAKIAENLGESEDVFRVDKAMAKRFLEVLLEVTGDDLSDRHSRISTFESTWAKADQGASVTGATRIAALTGDELILGKLYILLTDSPGIAAIDEFTDRFALWQGPGIIIDMKTEEGAEKPYMTRRQFCDSYGHVSVESVGKRKLVAELLFSLKTTLRVIGQTFMPGHTRVVEDQGLRFNRWRGFSVDPWPDHVRNADVQPFLEYLNFVVADQDDHAYEWILAWIAHIFKEPANKAGTALVLVGPPGIGKSFLGQHFLMPIIGRHATVTNQIERAVQGFNAAFEDRIFVQCDEAISNRQRLMAAKLKSFITDATITIERKGLDPYTEPNHMRLLFTSNETQDAVFLSDGVVDRRYTVIRVSDKQMQKAKYWVPLAAWAKDQKNLAKVHRYLRDVDYSRATIMMPLFTEAKTEMQQHSMSLQDRWLAAMVSRSHPLSETVHVSWWQAPIGTQHEVIRTKWPERVDLTALATDFFALMRNDAGRPMALNEQQILSLFRDRGLGFLNKPKRIQARDYDNRTQQFITRRVRLYDIPNREDIADFLRQKYGSEYDEDDDVIDIVDTEDTTKEEF